MRDVKRFPTTTGLSWLEMSSFKEHLFKGHEKIGKEYDYVIVGGGYGAVRIRQMPHFSGLICDCFSSGISSTFTAVPST